MVKEVKWTKTATKNFDRVVTYLSEEWTEQIVSDFINKTFSLLDFLSVHSEFGQYQQKEKGIRGVLITKHNRLFYRVKSNKLIVLRIFDTRQNPTRLKFR